MPSSSPCVSLPGFFPVDLIVCLFSLGLLLTKTGCWPQRHHGIVSGLPLALAPALQAWQKSSGKVADLTLFNPKTVAARATYKVGENGLPLAGIPYVIVNGTIVVKEGEVLTVKPGQPIRFPIEAKGRFQPVEVNTWLGEHAINVPDRHQIDDTGAGIMEKR